MLDHLSTCCSELFLLVFYTHQEQTMRIFQSPTQEDCFAKKHQNETFIDVKGQACIVSDDSAIAALYQLMPRILFNNLQMQVEEFHDWSDLFDRLQSYASIQVITKI